MEAGSALPLNGGVKCLQPWEGEKLSTRIDVEAYKALVDDAFRDAPLNIKQDKAALILSEAQKHFTREEFQELERYVFERLEV